MRNIIKMKQLIKKIFIFFIFALMIEIFVFNCKSIFSLNSKKIEISDYSIGKGLEKIEENKFFIKEKDNRFIEISNINEDIKNIYLDIRCYNSKNEVVPTKIKISIIDEGHSKYYLLPQISSFGTVEKTKYITIHGYGRVEKLKLDFAETVGTHLEIRDISLNTAVPFNLSIKRMLLFFFLFLILWFIKPSSELYNISYQATKRKIWWIAGVLLINISVLLVFVRLNSVFLEPYWAHHTQYEKLAVALSEGRTNIDVDFDAIEELENLENPYDRTQRDGVIDKISNVWDTAYYEGGFYVYFGIVPVMFFYLPYYLITGNGFPTWLGIFIMGSCLLVAVFGFMAKIIKRWFPNTPFLVYILLSLLMGNGIGTISLMLRPDFYSFPIIMAMFFTISGLTLWMSAAEMWEKEKKYIGVLFFSGSFFMALVAGCRPQFLVGSFFIFPIFGCLIKSKSFFNKKNIRRIIIGIVPYVIVASGLMYYNFIRFGSVFDFGANYNLTTNDMTLRGFEWGRIPDGIFQYLLQLPNIGLRFPYMEKVDLLSNYIGQTITEGMYGGVFFTHIFLLLVLCAGKVKQDLKKKRLWAFLLMSYCFTIVVVIADTQMAGLLCRYNADFLWLLYIPVVYIFLQLVEKNKNNQCRRILILILVTALVYEGFTSFMIGIQQGMMENYSPESFYRLKSIFNVF